MTDQRRPAADRGGEAQTPGYRGALPPRSDSLAQPWAVAVLVMFVLIFALSFANVPSTLFPSPSPSPVPSVSAAPSGSAAASGSAAGSASAAPTVSPVPGGSATATPIGSP